MLRAEVERDWEMAVAQLALARTVEPGAGAPEAALVALSLDHAYQAFENVLVRLERALGLPSRTGSDWHRSLLADAALSVWIATRTFPRRGGTRLGRAQALSSLLATC